MLMSICSKRVYYLVKLGRYRIQNVHVHLKTGDLQLEVNRTLLGYKDFCDVCFNSKENGAAVPNGCDSLSQWFRNGNSDVLNFTATNSIEDVLSVYNRLCSDFRVGRFCWKLFPEELKDRNLKELISTLDFDSCYKVSVLEGEIETEALSFLIDRMNSKIIFRITSEIPSNFKHPRALDFACLDYEDARWVTVNDLKTIRNASNVDLIGRTNFDNDDINELIKYWTECKEKMFTRLSIKLRDGVEIDVFGILEGVISCRSFGDQRHYYLSKKLIQTHSIGSFEVSDGIVMLRSCIFDSQLENMVPILKLLEQRSDLSMNYSELIKKERELQSILESVEDVEEENELEQAINKIEAEKRDVKTKFYDTVKQLKIRRITNFNEYLEPIA
ncbi:hypothetical protein CAEBREN_11878 [Caenorhabditis brenneri]|uniref:Sdz-33 F-box domain-containing protein n=1 Tax=Caenorhabditis brenneri TaxID=135651 RepID=G0NZ22_CAEBE|nr:hypothetical protein CAEBREN_11878 [Caenorhabditis brenneri]